MFWGWGVGKIGQKKIGKRCCGQKCRDRPGGDGRGTKPCKCLLGLLISEGRVRRNNPGTPPGRTGDQGEKDFTRKKKMCAQRKLENRRGFCKEGDWFKKARKTFERILKGTMGDPGKSGESLTLWRTDHLSKNKVKGGCPPQLGSEVKKGKNGEKKRGNKVFSLGEKGKCQGKKKSVSLSGDQGVGGGFRGQIETE